MKYLLFSEEFIEKSKTFEKIKLVGSYFYFKNIDHIKKFNNKDYFLLNFTEDELDEAFIYLKNLYEKIVNELSEQLNDIHGAEYTKSQWRIILGPWVSYFLQSTYMRWSTIDKLSKKEIFMCDIVNTDHQKLIPLDLNEFSGQIVNEKWNSIIFSEIIKLKKNSFKILSKKNIEYSDLEDYKNCKIYLKFFFSILNLFKNFTKYVFIDNYVGIKNQLFVQLKLKDLPFFYNKNHQRKKLSNSEFRNVKFKISAENEYELLINKIINFCLPKCYFEYYKDYKTEGSKIFPNKSKATVSSVRHQTDEYYKYWIAENKFKNRNFKFYVCQHGGFLGMGKFNFNTYTDIINSDKYLSWGWTDETKKVQPVGFFINYKKKNIQPKKVVSIILYSLPIYLRNFMPNVLQDKNIFLYEKQMELINSVKKELKNSLVIRPPIWNRDFYIKNIKEKFPEIKIDNSKFVMELYEKSKLLITTSNGTVFLQSLYLNTPTIGIWPKDDMILNSNAKKNFLNIETENLIFHNYNEAAKFINHIHIDPDKWWNESQTRKKVQTFANLYCNGNNNFQNFFVNELSN